MKKKTFHPPKVETLLDDIVDGKLLFPMQDSIDDLVPEWAIESSSTVWLRHLNSLASDLHDVRSFVVDKSPVSQRQEVEIFETCKALAQAGLFQLPYPQIWVETYMGFNVLMSAEADYVKTVKDMDSINCVGMLVTDLRAAINGLQEDLEKSSLDLDPSWINVIDKPGVVYSVFARIKTKGALRWYDLLHSCVMLEEGMARGEWVYDTIPLNVPAIIDAIATVYKRSTPKWKNTIAKGASLHTGITEMCEYLGVRLITKFMAALNTSWVTKSEKDPGLRQRPAMSLKRKVKSQLQQVGTKRKVERSYILIDSFNTSMLRAAKASGIARKKVVPHLRRGHIHRFWTGPKSDPDARKLISKFVQPTWINKADDVKPEIKDYRVIA